MCFDKHHEVLPVAQGEMSNDVDLEAFYPSKVIEAAPTILFVETYQSHKRGRLLMEAFQKEIYPELPEAQLWMVCSDAPRGPEVTVFGRLSIEELCDLYRRAWVFCLPSSYEGFGVPYIEAMASGIPVVATPNVGACEVLGSGRFGMIVLPRTLGSGLLKLLREGSGRGRLRHLGLERAREYGWNRVAGLYEDVYAELVAERAGVGRCSAHP